MVDLLSGYSEGVYRGDVGRDLLAGMSEEEIQMRLSTPSVIPQEPPVGTSGLEQASVTARRGAEMLASPVEVATEFATSVPAWAVGAIAGVGAGAGEKLRGGDAGKAFRETIEEYSGKVSDLLSPLRPITPPGPEGRAGSHMVGKGIETVLGAAKQVANVEGDLYKGIGLKPLKETHPYVGELAGLAVELMTFKAAHSAGASVRRGFNRMARRVEALRQKPASEWTDSDIKLLETMAEQLKRERPEELKLLEWDPDEVVRDFKLGRVTEETSRRPIKAGGPEAEPLALPAPEVPGGGEPVGGTDLAPSGSPKIAKTIKRKAGHYVLESDPNVHFVKDKNKWFIRTYDEVGGIQPQEGPFKSLRQAKKSYSPRSTHRVPDKVEGPKLDVVEGGRDPEALITEVDIPEGTIRDEYQRRVAEREAIEGKYPTVADALADRAREKLKAVEPPVEEFVGDKYVPAIQSGSGDIAVGPNHGMAYLEMDRREIDGKRTSGWYDEDAGVFLTDKEYFAKLKEQGIDSPKSFKEGSLQKRELKSRLIKSPVEEPKVIPLRSEAETKSLLAQQGIDAIKALENEPPLREGTPEYLDSLLEPSMGETPMFQVWSDPAKYEQALKIVRDHIRENFGGEGGVKDFNRMLKYNREKKKMTPSQSIEYAFDEILNPDVDVATKGKPRLVKSKKKVAELANLPLKDALEKIKPLLDEVEEYVRTGKGKPLELSKKVSEAYDLSNDPQFYEGLDKVTQTIAAKARALGGERSARKIRERAQAQSERARQERQVTSPEGRILEEGEGQVRVRDTAEDRVAPEQVRYDLGDYADSKGITLEVREFDDVLFIDNIEIPKGKESAGAAVIRKLARESKNLNKPIAGDIVNKDLRSKLLEKGVKISRENKELYDNLGGEVIKSFTPENVAKGVDRWKNIQDKFNEIEQKIRSKGYEVTLSDEGQFVTMENLQGKEGKGIGRNRPLKRLMDEALRVTAEAGKDLEATPSHPAIEKFLLDIGGTKEIGSLHVSNAALREYVKSRAFTPENVAKGVDLIRQRHEKLFGKEGERAKAQLEFERDIREGLESEAKAANQAELDRLIEEQGRELDAETYTAEDYFERGDYERAAKEYDREMSDDWQLADYGIDDMAKDVYQAFFKDERGSFSFNEMSPEKIQALHRLWQKANDLGRNLAEYLKAAIPELTDADIRKIEQFAQDHFVDRRTFKTPEGTGPLETIKPRKARKVLGRVVSYPEYFKKYLDGWKGSKPVEFATAVGGRVGTVPRVFFRQFPWLAEELYYPWRRAFKNAKLRKAHIKGILNNLKSGINKASRKRIRDYAMSKQENGIELLKASGVDVVPKLTKQEMYVYNELRAGFDRLYEEVNNMRASIGKNPFKKVDDYFTFLRAVGQMEKMGLTGEAFSKEARYVMNEYAKMKATPFRFAKRRGKTAKYKLEDDPFKIFQTYANMAIDHVEISPIVAKARTILEPVRDPGKAKMTKRGKVSQVTFNPFKGPHEKTAMYVRDWAQKISGVPMGFDAAHPLAAKRLGMANRNLGASILGFKLRSALIQPTALLNTFTEIGPSYTAKGVYDMLSPAKRRQAMVKSDVLYPRNFDATVGEMLGDLKDIKVGEFPKYARAFSMKGLEWLDMLTARATWNGAYSKAKMKYKMSVADAARYADDVVVRTQASGAPGEIAPIQHTSIGKTGTMFQTFVINNWNFLVHDVVGAKSGATVGQVMPKVIRYVVGAAAINMLYEDLLGIKSPLPRPVKNFIDSMEQGNTAIDVAIDTTKELIEPIPILGNARYGSNPFGPLVEKAGDAFKMLDKRERRGDKALELAGTALGVPGTSQAAVSYRAAKRGESPWGIAVGRYSEADKRTRRSRRSRSSSR